MRRLSSSKQICQAVTILLNLVTILLNFYINEKQPMIYLDYLAERTIPTFALIYLRSKIFSTNFCFDLERERMQRRIQRQIIKIELIGTHSVYALRIELKIDKDTFVSFLFAKLVSIFLKDNFINKCLSSLRSSAST